jgi:hypothetical protein
MWLWHGSGGKDNCIPSLQGRSLRDYGTDLLFESARKFTRMNSLRQHSNQLQQQGKQPAIINRICDLFNGSARKFTSMNSLRQHSNQLQQQGKQ